MSEKQYAQRIAFCVIAGCAVLVPLGAAVVSGTRTAPASASGTYGAR